MVISLLPSCQLLQENGTEDICLYSSVCPGSAQAKLLRQHSSSESQYRHSQFHHIMGYSLSNTVSWAVLLGGGALSRHSCLLASWAPLPAGSWHPCKCWQQESSCDSSKQLHPRMGGINLTSSSAERTHWSSTTGRREDSGTWEEVTSSWGGAGYKLCSALWALNQGSADLSIKYLALAQSNVNAVPQIKQGWHPTTWRAYSYSQSFTSRAAQVLTLARLLLYYTSQTLTVANSRYLRKI